MIVSLAVDAGDLAALQHAYVSLLALLLALLPIENAEGAELELDEQELGAPYAPVS